MAPPRQAKATTPMPLSPNNSHTHLSPKAKSLSTSPNFNPFAPLSPHQAHKRVDDFQEDAFAATSSRRVYTREEMLRIASDCRRSGWTIPDSLKPLNQWYGSSGKMAVEDPAIISIGQGPGRKAPGFGEGFGFGGGIGGKVLGRGGRQTGHPHSQGDTRSRRSEHDPTSLPVPGKDALSGQMGRFAMKSPSDRTRPTAVEDRKTRDDWRKAPGQVPMHRSERADRQDRRQWNDRNGDDAMQPAWMDDERDADIDPAIVQDSQESLPFQFGLGEDPIAAHKRMMKAAAEGRVPDAHRRAPAQFNMETGGAEQSKTTKTPKQFNAADYLLPSKVNSTATSPSASNEPQNTRSGVHSRFQRFFGAQHDDPPTLRQDAAISLATTAVRDGQDRRLPDHHYYESSPSPAARESIHHHVSSPPPGMTSPPPTQDHASRLMGLLTAKTSNLSHPAPDRTAYPIRPPSPPHSGQPDRLPFVSPPPGVPFGSHPPVVFDPRQAAHRVDASQLLNPLPPPVYPPQYRHTGPFGSFPPMMHAGTSAPDFPPPQGLYAGPPPLPARQDYTSSTEAVSYGNPQTMGPSHTQLPARQQNMLATLYGNLQQGTR